MTTIAGHARLHFGLLHVPGGDPDGARRFGGCGLMLDSPKVVVTATASDVEAVAGESAERAARVMERLRAAAPPGARPLSVRVEECPPEHVGLGVGTQLSLALAAALAAEWGIDERLLIGATGRGERSGVGLHGARLGGFVADCGRGPSSAAAPLLARLEFPPEWPVVLAYPPAAGGWHGEQERAAFAAPAPAATGAMCRLLVLGIIPAIQERDYPAFAEALSEYNRLAGAPFAATQGGVYSSPAVAGLVELAREFGFGAAGQSSWGEATFAIGDDPARAGELAAAMRAARPGWAVLVTRGWGGSI